MDEDQREEMLYSELPDDYVPELEDEPDTDDGLAEKAGKVALSMLAATSLTAALAEPPRTDLMTVPEPTPIVMVLDETEDEAPKDLVEEQGEDEKQRLRRILRLLRLLIVALLLTAAIVFGVLKGCASCTATVLAPDEQEQQEQGEGQEQAQDQEQDKAA